MTPAVRNLVMEKPGAVLAADFSEGVMPSFMTFARASGATSGTYLDATGSSYTTYTTSQPRFMAGGVRVEPPATNRLLNSTAPVTQTTASLATGTYCLWVIGSGSATSSAGTAIGSGFGAATAGVPNVITLTGAGTVTVTVAGSLDRFQLELAAEPTTFIVTAGVVATRARDELYSSTSLISPEAGALVVDATLDVVLTGAVMCGFATSNISECLYYTVDSGNTIARYGGVSLANFLFGTPVAGRHRVAISYGNGKFSGAVDGLGQEADIPLPAPYPLWTGRFTLGCAPWTLPGQITGTVHSFKLYRRYFPPTYLGAITR